MKAGKLAYGTDMCLDKIKFNKAKLIVVANDASDNTKSKFSNICEDKAIPFFEYGNKLELSRAIGKDNKTVFAVLDKNFAESIIKMLKDNKGAIC